VSIWQRSALAASWPAQLLALANVRARRYSLMQGLTQRMLQRLQRPERQTLRWMLPLRLQA
jgi:hypothetical protein